MSEKELLYVEDMLGHLDYFKSHLLISKECLSKKEYLSVLEKIIKKVDMMYDTFYGLLGGK